MAASGKEDCFHEIRDNESDFDLSSEKFCALQLPFKEELGITEAAAILRTGKSIDILICGKTGCGKSTLINGLMGANIMKEESANEGYKLSHCTSKVKAYKETKHNTGITVWTTPGLLDSTGNEQAYLEDIRDTCPPLHLKLFCIDCSQTRFVRGPNNTDFVVMQKYTDAFGTEFWSNTIIVLTMANNVSAFKPKWKTMPPAEMKRKYIHHMKDFTKLVQSILIEDLALPEDLVSKIKIVPAGYYSERNLPDRDYWLSNFFTECLNALPSLEAKGAFINFNLGRFVSINEVEESSSVRDIKDQPTVTDVENALSEMKGVHSDFKAKKNKEKNMHALTSKMSDLSSPDDHVRALEKQLQATKLREKALEKQLKAVNLREKALEKQLQATKLQEKDTQQWCDELLLKKDRELIAKDQELAVVRNDTERELREVEMNLHDLTATIQQLQEDLQRSDRRTQLAEERVDGLETQWVVRRNEILMTETKLGGGGWGEVKVAKFRGIEVAAKMLYTQLQGEYYRDSFVREMNMAARLRHPHLVQFIGATLEGEMIILTELMSTSLRSVLESGRISRDQILSISVQVCQALNYLHLMTPNPVIHRDVSSANILLDPLPNDCWRAKVTDYGSVNLQQMLNTANPGSPVYAAPEARTPSLQSTKMDIFSMGVLMIEMCTGRFPSDENRERLLLTIQDRTFSVIINRCITTERNNRPTAGELLTLLQ